MKKIKIYEVNKNEVVIEFETNKRKLNSIQTDVVQKLKDKYGTIVISGKIIFGDKNNTYLLGGNLGWTAGNNTFFQITID